MFAKKNSTPLYVKSVIFFCVHQYPLFFMKCETDGGTDKNGHNDVFEKPMMFSVCESIKTKRIWTDFKKGKLFNLLNFHIQLHGV